MAVYIGNAGSIELTRTGIAGALSSVVTTGDVNPTVNRFGFDFPAGSILTGDFIEIKSTVNLAFIASTGWAAGSVFSSGNWYVNIDYAGGVTLYSTFAAALAGETTGRVDLVAIGADIPISVSVVNTVPRALGQVVSYDFTTDRETVDISSLGDEFRQQYSTMITGSGRITCLFDYAYASGTTYKVPTGAASYPELAVYLHALLLRQQFGSEFKAKLYIIGAGQGQGRLALNDTVWHEITGIVTQAGITFESDTAMTSTIQFVTTGPISLRTLTTPPSYLTQEDGGRIKLEDSTGYILLEEQ